MKILCISCTKADLRKAKVQLPGTIRGEDYTVEMEGLECPNCGYKTVDGKSMAEFGRLVADKYRSAHDLLTSDEIVALRHRFGENQPEFANRVGVGVASIKRWELGKIQDRQSNDLLIEKTKPQVENLQQYNFQAITGGTSLWLDCTVNAGSYSTQRNTDIRVNAATVPPYIASWRIRGDNDRNTTASAA